jgi:seryl-tRNA synthetase
MIDLEILRNNPEKVKNAIINKGIKNFDFDTFLKLDKDRLSILKKLEESRNERNKISDEISKLNNTEKSLKLQEASFLKQEIKKLEEEFSTYDNQFKIELLKLPNIPSEKMPVGQSEGDNVVVKAWTKQTGEVTPKNLNDSNFIQKDNFQFLDHLQLGKIHDMIDTEKSAEVSGSRFSYLKNEAVYLQDAISIMLKQKLKMHGFKPMIPPLMVLDKALYGTSHFPEGKDQVYQIKNDFVEEGRELFLVGSSEPVNFAYFSNSVFNENELPKKFFAQTTCFRSEVGSWGRDVRGIKRVHQFDKLEMNAITTEDNAEQIFDELLHINEWLLQQLELPYRVVNKCTGDSGYNASFFQYDLEVYRLATNEWMETMTATNTSDFQARRLNIKYKDSTGKTRYAFTLNDTGVAFGRIILALMENHQDSHGNIKIPEILQSHLGIEKIEAKIN